MVGGGVATFIGASDTPPSYKGHAGDCVMVNQDEDATVFDVCAGMPGPAGVDSSIQVTVYTLHPDGDTNFPTPTGGVWTLGLGLSTVPTGWYRTTPAVTAGNVLVAATTDTIDVGSYNPGDDISLATHWGTAFVYEGGGLLAIPPAPPVQIVNNMQWGTANVSVTVTGWRTYRFIQFVVDENGAAENFASASVATALLDDNASLKVSLQQNYGLTITHSSNDVITLVPSGFTTSSADTLDVWGIP